MGDRPRGPSLIRRVFLQWAETGMTGRSGSGLYGGRVLWWSSSLSALVKI